jgi:glycosyltransferase involved in cell wall biosynthesis
MINVIFDHQIFSLQKFGGATRYFRNLVQAFIENPEIRIECQLGLSDDGIHNSPIGSSIRGSSWGPITPKHGLLRYSINEIFAYYYKMKYEKNSTPRVHHCTYIYPPHPVRNAALVVTHHDCTLERFHEQFHRSSVTIKAKKKIYEQADRIIAISNHSKHDLMTFYDIPESKIHVVYHGVEQPLLIDMTSSPSGTDARPFLLYVGARTFYKNFNGLLKAFAKSNSQDEFRLLAVGGGSFTTGEIDLIRKLRIEDKIINIPYASQLELAWLYYHAHGLVYPSTYEGFGFPPLEAMSMGCPALVSNSSCLPEILGEAPLYFESENDDDLCEKLDSLCYNSELRTSLVKKGMTVVKLYTWKRSAHETLSVYKNALA